MSVKSDQWAGVDLRHLEALVAVAREGSFRAAAARLDYVPSAISTQIASLEKSLGVRLVERSRGPGRVTLTEAGELLLQHAETIVARLQAAQADLAAFADGAVGSLRVGITQSVGIRVLPTLMHRFSARWPDVHLRPTESETDIALYEGVERGELDLAFVELPPPDGPFETFELLADPYVLLVRADSPLAEQGEARLDDLRDLELIGYSQCRGLRRVEAQLQARGAEPNFVVRSDVNATVQALVAAGVGSAIIPQLGVDPADARTAIVQLSRSVTVPPRVLAIAWHRDRYHAEAVRDFVDAAREVCAEIDGARRAPVALTAT